VIDIDVAVWRRRGFALNRYFYLSTSSSSIDSPVTYARLACSLPYTWVMCLTSTALFASYFLTVLQPVLQFNKARTDLFYMQKYGLGAF